MLRKLTMLSLFKRENKESKNHFLVLDIGTDVVKALVCEPQPDAVVIRGVGRVHQGFSSMQSGVVIDIGSVVETCAKAIKDAQEQAGVKVYDTIMSIGGELVKGLTHRSTYERKEAQVKIDLQELKNIIQKMQWKSFEETRNKLAFETGYSAVEIKLVNAAIIEVLIDGFHVDNPIGFQGKEVDITIFNSFAPLVHYGALQTIASELDLNLMTICCEPYALSRVLEVKEQKNPSGIFIDIGAGTTSIAVVNGGVVEGVKMFNIGGRSFTKRIASVLNISLDEADEIKAAYSHQKLEKHSEKIVKDALIDDIDVWLSGVIYSLSEFTNVEVLPPQLYICGGSSHLPEIKKALQTHDWESSLPFSKQPHVSLLQPSSLPGIKDATRTLTGPEDVTPLALARLGQEFIGEEHIMMKLMKKIVRLVQV